MTPLPSRVFVYLDDGHQKLRLSHTCAPPRFDDSPAERQSRPLEVSPSTLTHLCIFTRAKEQSTYNQNRSHGSPRCHLLLGTCSPANKHRGRPSNDSQWIPVFSAAVWLGTLLGMLLWWIVTVDRKRLPTLDADMSLPYISDIGAVTLKPLFIAGSVVTTITLDLSFAAERWLRHKGRLAPNKSLGEKVLMALTIIFAIVGTVGLICLSIFDTWRHAQLHDIFLILFIGGYLISAIFICWEYQRLGISTFPSAPTRREQ